MPSAQQLLEQIKKLERENKRLKDELKEKSKSKFILNDLLFNFESIFDIRAVKQLIDKLHKDTGIPVAVFNNKHNLIISSGWRNNISTKSTREITTPIIVEEQIIANITISQFFYDDEHINWNYIGEQANNFNINKQEYIENLNNLPRFSRKKIELVSQFISLFSKITTEQALTNIKLKKEVLIRKDTEEKLQNSQAQLNTIINAIPTPIFYKNYEGKYTGCNEAFSNFIGKPKNEILGHTVFNITSSDIAAKCHQSDKQLKKSGAKQILDTKVNNYDGSIRDVTFLKSTYTSPNEKFGGIVAMMLDVTKQNSIKEAIRKSEEKFRAISETVPMGIFLSDTQGKNIYVNKNYLELTGYSKDEIMGENWHNIIHPEFRVSIVEYWKQAISKEKFNFDKVYRLCCKNNHTIWVHVRACRMNTGVTDEAYLGVVEDITQRLKDQENLLKAKEKAEESDRLKSAFLANMSHEIRTPMNGILGFSEMLLTPNLAPQNHNRYIKIINECGNQLLSIINDIIDISKIEAGQVTINKQSINIKDLIDEIKSFFEPLAQKKGLNLYLENNSSSRETTIITDGVKLRQIITNLLSNAIKFTHEGFVLLRYIIEKDFIKVSVEDTGIGITPEEQGNVFKRFMQANNSPNNPYGGTGLGLSITKAYVKILGGTITLKSQKEIGSTFTFTIPYKTKI